jgi:hypothetical protein
MPISANLSLILIRLPILLLNFWLIEGPVNILSTTWILTRSVANVLSVPILLRTFFAPWKGEYRKGYVGIARGIGITVRLFTLLVSILILTTVLTLGTALAILWVLAPILWIGLLTAGIFGVNL